MKLIEFLIRNWFIVIILLAVYAQFRNKAARGVREADRRTPAMPSFGGPVPSAPTSRQSGKEASSLSSRPSTQQQVLRSQTKNNDRRSLIDSSTERRTANTQPYLEGKDRSSSPFSSSKKGEGIPGVLPDQETMGGIERLDIQLNRQQLAQGIIWSEILGPPRAKKPYRR